MAEVPVPDSGDGRTFARETIDRKLRWHGFGFNVIKLERDGFAIDTAEGEGPERRWWLKPGWYEHAKICDATDRLEGCTCAPGGSMFCPYHY